MSKLKRVVTPEIIPHAAKCSANDEPMVTRAHRNKAEAGASIRAAQAQGLVPKLLTIEELGAFLQRSRASIYRDVLARRLPPPLKLGERCSRWNLDSVQAAIGLQSAA